MIFYNGHDGDASSIQEITIDKEKPRKPNLHTIESPTSDKNLVFKWDFIENASYYLYRFNESSWIKITNKTTNVTIPASEGSNVFKIKVVDAFANHSDESESIVIVDTTPQNQLLHKLVVLQIKNLHLHGMHELWFKGIAV